MHSRCGQLSRKSVLLGITREVHFSDISFRVYRFVRRFYVANQTSTTCRLCLESTVETSTPPFFGRAHHAGALAILQPRELKARLASSLAACRFTACKRFSSSRFWRWSRLLSAPALPAAPNRRRTFTRAMRRTSATRRRARVARKATTSGDAGCGFLRRRNTRCGR
jgi:hypothetical protein